MTFSAQVAGRLGNRRYYAAEYKPEDDIRLPFDGLPFVCLIHRVGAALSPKQIQSLAKRLLAHNARAFYCVGEGAKTMKGLIEEISVGEGWTRKYHCPIPVSWRETVDVGQAVADFSLCEAGDNTLAHYGLALVAGDPSLTQAYLKALMNSD